MRIRIGKTEAELRVREYHDQERMRHLAQWRPVYVWFRKVAPGDYRMFEMVHRRLLLSYRWDAPFSFIRADMWEYAP